jgi:hypothetical protein
VLFVHSIVHPSEMVRAQTLVVLSQSVGQIVGSLISGALIDSLGLRPLLMVGGIILLAAGCLMVACNRTHARQLTQEKLTQWALIQEKNSDWARSYEVDIRLEICLTIPRIVSQPALSKEKRNSTDFKRTTFWPILGWSTSDHPSSFHEQAALDSGLPKW